MRNLSLLTEGMVQSKVTLEVQFYLDAMCLPNHFASAI